MRMLLILLAAVVVIVLGLWATLVLYFDEARLKQIATEQVREQTGRELSIDGDLELDLFPGISIVARDVNLSGPTDYQGPELFRAEEFRMSVALMPLLSGRVETGDIVLDEAEVNLHTDRAGTSSLAGLLGGSDSPAESGTAPEVSTERISLRGVRLVLSDAATDSRQVFVVEMLDVESFRYGEPTAFEFKGSLGEPPIISDIDLTGELTVPAGDGPVQISRLELDGNLSGLEMALSGSAEVQPGPPLAARFMDGRLSLDEQTFRTAFSFVDDGTRPRIEASLEGAMLDVDALLPAGTGPSNGEQTPTGSPAGEEDSPLLLLREVDLVADMSLQGMKVSGLSLQDVRARVEGIDGEVRVDPLSASLDGGRLDATAYIDVNAEPPRLQLSPVFELESLSRALAAWNLDRFLTGAGTLEMQLTARGLDAQSVLGTLDGSGEYDLRNGSLRGLNLNALVEGLAARNVAQAVSAGVGGSTDFERLAGNLRIDDGTVRLPGLELVSRAIGLTGDVRLGLADLSLDGQVRFEREELRNIPIALEGTLTQPKFVPDVGEALREEAGRRVLDFLRERAGGDEDDGGNGG